MQINWVTPQIINKMNDQNKFVAVWVDGTAPKAIASESAAFLEKLYELGVHMFTSDYPLNANSTLE